jgi:transposase
MLKIAKEMDRIAEQKPTPTYTAKTTGDAVLEAFVGEANLDKVNKCLKDWDFNYKPIGKITYTGNVATFTLQDINTKTKFNVTITAKVTKA